MVEIHVFSGIVIFVLRFGSVLTRHTHDIDDRVGWADKEKVINITKECIMDAQMRIRQVYDVRDQHTHQLAFDVGIVMGNMREKYRRMVETYREYRDKHSKRSTFFPPGWSKYVRAGYYIVAMQLIRIQEIEIDKYVHILESLEDERLNPDPRYEKEEKSSKKKALKEEEKETVKGMEDEQELKSSMREQHLLRRLHLPPAHHTTAKRFQKQWPVERNWELGAYGDMGLYAGH